jgi:hypothetical protein
MQTDFWEIPFDCNLSSNPYRPLPGFYEFKHQHQKFINKHHTTKDERKFRGENLSEKLFSSAAE